MNIEPFELCTRPDRSAKRCEQVALLPIEPLEARIAPASVTFTDVDGDKVTVTTTGPGTLALLGNVQVFDGQLRRLDLRDAAFQGANVSITATRDPVNGGDGFVNVGQILATG